MMKTMFGGPTGRCPNPGSTPEASATAPTAARCNSLRRVTSFWIGNFAPYRKRKMHLGCILRRVLFECFSQVYTHADVVRAWMTGNSENERVEINWWT